MASTPPTSDTSSDHESTPEGVGLSNPQLRHGRRQMLDLVNKPHSTGVQVDIDLPQITVIGSQSAGKSSLIESISRKTLPRAAISITTSRNDQAAAAAYLSDTLRRLECPHAYIGGFAWALLGNKRPTEMSPFFTSIVTPISLYYDIDVLIETKNLDMLVLREQLQELSKQFASAGIKLYYVKEPLGDLRGDELVRASKNNVLIDTLSAGTLGLPSIAGPIYEVEHDSGISIDVLHPGVLILTKMKRWFLNIESTRPNTVLKNKSDRRDLDYLIMWLAHENMTIEFELYKGKHKDELLKFVRRYREQVGEDIHLMEALKTAMKPEDWKLLDIPIPGHT